MFVEKSLKSISTLFKNKQMFDCIAGFFIEFTKRQISHEYLPTLSKYMRKIFGIQHWIDIQIPRCIEFHVRYHWYQNAHFFFANYVPSSDAGSNLQMFALSYYSKTFNNNLNPLINSIQRTNKLTWLKFSR